MLTKTQFYKNIDILYFCIILFNDKKYIKDTENAN